ncbi:xanthine dehydrogenase molybdopterin binding subunit [Psychrobacter sp. TAE2020]|uniref:xanthine dehydrogenase molybdopterin binding subunit n=1 Tax=Psychrobacter sp. TAE2020 TaxID=2846762 RepID=UPI001C11E38C|nr:xanthine dehydrogenase molybdopterin binding subunit [Psychrobacter sp. TAE2020]MBU5615966.1 xanthine dehydrogenase molybdopterin binding subunit [Psychrobacter sp. TAE2020]
MSHHSSLFDSYNIRRVRPPKNKIGTSAKHDSAISHVMGSATYVDDILKPQDTLHVAIGKSTQAHARILSMDLSEVKAAAGVVDVITFADLPAKTDIGPVFDGDPLMVDQITEYVGQTLFAVVAVSHRAAKKASLKALVNYEPLPAILTIEQALEQEQFVRPSHFMQRGDTEAELDKATTRIAGHIHMLGQEHFYLEGQVSYVVPCDDGGLEVYTSSQHPSEVQQLVAEVVDLPFHAVTTIVRRMGGGFGGKETQAAAWACLCGVVAKRHNVPVSMRLDRQDDMVATGKRHEFANCYDVGINDAGQILAVDMQLSALCGYSPDLSDAIVDRAMFHCDNAYYYPAAQIAGHRCKTHTVSNTAYRGFGGPQGLLTAEYMMDHIAYTLGKDPLQVRLANLYQNGQSTHYGQPIEHFDLATIMNTLATDCDYEQRRQQIMAANKKAEAEGSDKRLGLALTPVKFGISFTVQHLNQAGALVHIYTDGTIQINHGGTEMGQGLYIKIAQIVANEFDVDLDTVKATATRTDKVPNTSPTAASSGTDINGKAAQNACITIRQRIVEFAAEHFAVAPEAIRFENNHVYIGDKEELTFAEMVLLAYQHRVSLSATGYYKTPKIFYDRSKAWGRPFFYFALGASCSEVEIDTLTGEYTVLRCDILHDVGQSINPAIDIGQIEGAFVQGMGWLTAEELVWDSKGNLASNSAANYKIPTAHDLPKQWTVNLFDRKNEEQTIYNSKAVGEPPFMLAASVWCAINNAVASLGNYHKNPELTMPATPEAVLKAVMRMQGEPWEIDTDVNAAAIDSLTNNVDYNHVNQDGDDGINDDKVKPQQVSHGKDVNPPEVAGQLVDDQPEAIKNPNVSVSRGPAHSE